MDLNAQMRFIHEIFDPKLPRLGPGDEQSTKRAIEIVKEARGLGYEQADATECKVLDIGCGNGSQALVLASNTDWRITAIDNHQPYLDELARRAQSAGVARQIETIRMDMTEMNFDSNSFDVIWSEGALCIMGIAEGLAATNDLLNEGGVVAFTELCWFKENPPKRCHEYFQSEYTGMTDINSTRSIIDRAGFELLDYFALPDSAWLDNYYGPLEARLGPLRAKYAEDEGWLEIIDWTQEEIELYRKYSEYYGYGFFVAGKR